MTAPHRKDELRTALRHLRIELAINTSRVARLAELHDSDLAVLDVLNRDGPQSPTDLARRTGTHAATMTGVLRRLERDGWIVRHPNEDDRRGFKVQSTHAARLTSIYRDGNRRLDQIASALTTEQAGVVLGYLRAVSEAVRAASDELEQPNDL